MHRGEDALHGKMVPVSDFYRCGDRNGGLRAWCKLCEARRRGGGGYVSVVTIRPFLTELINRVGKMETARRLGMDRTGLRYLINEARWTQLKTATSIITELKKARDSDEVRHRHSIRYGATRRGRPERPVLNRSRDIYKRHRDVDNENSRLNRAKKSG